VEAAEYHTDAELGGAWSAVVQRLADNGGVALMLSEPCTLDLWRTSQDPVTATPTLSVNAVIADNGKSARLHITPEQLATLGVGRFEHRLVISDAVIGPQVMARGWFTVRGRVSDL
jgi:hypothetical protein